MKNEIIGEEAEDFEVTDVLYAEDKIMQGWLLDLVEETDKIYIKRVGNHLEIGKADVHCIE